jgi:MFS family permease
MPGVSPATPRRVVLLLTAAVCINYIDRGNLATAAPLIQDQLHLSSTQLGFLLSAFFWTYVVAMAPAGWLAETFGARRVLAVGVAVWSLATLLTGFATGLLALLLLRLLLGLGESVTFPCVSKALASEVPRTQLGFANGVMTAGYLVGPAIGTLLGGVLMAHTGWRAVFVLFGSCSLLWIWPWLRTGPPAAAPAAAAGADGRTDAPSYSQILRQRGLWGASLGSFSANYNFYFILAWLPSYLVRARGFSLASMAEVASIAYLINAVSALAMGWLTDRWCRTGHSPDFVYKGAMVFGHVASIVCMVGMVLLPLRESIACLFIYEVAAGVSSPGYFAIPQILAGPTAAGRWVGIQNTWGNASGIVAPAITGLMVDWSGTFASAFVLAGAVNVLGIIGWVFILPRIAPLDWKAMARMAAR